MKKFIKKNFTKIIISLSVALSCLCVFFGVSTTYAFTRKDNIIQNENYQDVWYSNTMNINSYLDTYNDYNKYYMSNDEIGVEFTTNKDEPDTYHLFGFNFLNRYYYQNYPNNRFIPQMPIVVSITMNLYIYIDNNGGEWVQLSFDSGSDYYINDNLLDSDIDTIFGWYNTHSGDLELAQFQTKNYYYIHDNLETITFYFVREFDNRDINYSELEFGFVNDELYESGVNARLGITNIEIADYNTFVDLVKDYRFNYDTLNNNYNQLQENYNQLQDDYVELENKYNEYIQTYNDIINGELPFRESNIRRIDVSISNMGNISDDYDYILNIKNKQIEIDSGAIRDIVDAYNVSQDDNTSINIVLYLNSPVNLYYLYIKVNSSQFEYSFSFNTSLNVVDYVAMNSTYGEDANGEYINSNVNRISQIIITISNVNNSHYGDSNTYIQTNATYFDGYSQAYKELSDEINGYKQQNQSLRETIENNNRSISVLRQEVSDLQEQVSNNFGFKNIFFAMADTPFKTASNFLGFDLFGINLFQAFIGFITVLACIWLIKKLI